ncbi:hypothetical protein B0H14DRAFT_2781599, partial [Mycena olivaceomarginata]
MLDEFARVLLRESNTKWDPTERRINCLAHVINLATQKLISTYSKASHFNTHDPNTHIPDTTHSLGQRRDEIGLLRAIAVKERSSAKRKELFRGNTAPRSRQSRRCRAADDSRHESPLVINICYARSCYF